MVSVNSKNQFSTKSIMVKNTHGGSGHKKFGRKFANNGGGNSRLRVSENEYEMYAIVTKMCGNNMVHVHCIDDGMRLCHIRGKFTGRRKRDNFVTIGGWVMVGLRECDDAIVTAADFAAGRKLAGCDLLEVYSSAEKEQLKSNVDEKWSILMSHDTSSVVRGENKKDQIEEDVRFTTEHEEDLDALLLETKTGVKTIGTSDSHHTEAIDVDCI